jgi:subtilisin-like proprotein convertase family protein
MPDFRSGAARFRDAVLQARAAKQNRPSGPANARRLISSGTVNNRAQDTTENDAQLDPTVLDLGGVNMVAAFTDIGAAGYHLTGYAYSSSSGITWTDAGELPDSDVGDGGFPVLAHDKTSGAVYIATLGLGGDDQNIQVFKSTDLGHTFGSPVNGTPGFEGTGEFHDAPSLAVDNFAGAGQGNIYLCWTDFFGGGAEIRLTRSTDQGASFGPEFLESPVISTGGQGCSVVVSPNHQVYVFYYRGTANGRFRNGGDNKLFVRGSADFGVTFGAEVQVADLNTTAVNGDLQLKGGLLSDSFPRVAVNPIAARPYLYVVYNDDASPANTANDNGNVYYVYSKNNGATWSAPQAVSALVGDQFFPSIAFDQSERLLISFHSRNHDPSNLAFHRRGRPGKLSAAGAIAFNGAGFQLSPNSPVATEDGLYLGGRDAGGNTRISAIWSDNRIGNGFHLAQPDVRFAQINMPAATADLDVDVEMGNPNIPLTGETNLSVVATANGGTARDVFVNFVAPFGLKFQSHPPGDACTETYGGGFLACSLGTIPSGQAKTTVVIVNGVYRAGSRTVTATGTTSSNDANAGNNSGSDIVNVNPTTVATATYSTGNIAVAIQDLGTVEVPLNVPHFGFASQIVARLRLNHTWDSELHISLVAPSGKTVDLSTANGGSDDNYGSGANNCSGTKTAFSDLAVTSITNASSPFAGTFKPEWPIRSVLAEQVNGEWKLRVEDRVGLDVGTIGCFQLLITRVP